MIKLTSKQEMFVQGLVSGLSQRKAFRKAYPTSESWKDSAVDSEASRTLKMPKVSARYNELMGEHKEKALWTRENSTNQTKKLIKEGWEIAKRKGLESTGYNLVLNSIKELNKLEGLYPSEKHEISGNLNVSDHAEKYKKYLMGDRDDT